MKTLGLLGGMSWESTVPYYRLINEGIKQGLGGLHSARIILYSVDFADVERLQRTGDWVAAGALLAQAAQKLEGAGAEALVLCTNTMHKVANAIESAVQIPLLHIADPTAMQIRQAGLSTVGLLGTCFTMEQPFYKDRLVQRHGLQVLVPSAADREMVHRYLATGVGVLILSLAFMTWRQRLRDPSHAVNPWRPTFTLLWVCLQGAFGALTVTMKLFPAIVTLHLMGGVLLLALLARQAARQQALLSPAPQGDASHPGVLTLLRWALALALTLLLTDRKSVV